MTSAARVLLLLTLILTSTRTFPARAANDTALRLANVSGSNTAYVRVPNSAAFSLTQFTLEAWVQRVGAGYGFSTDPSGASIISKPVEGASGSNIASWHMHWTNAGQVHFNLTHTFTSSGVYLLSPAVATPLGRHHLAVTFDTDSIRIMIDGVQVAQSFWGLGSVYYGANDVLIGADNFDFGYFRRFDGYIDDVRIWNYARTPAQIAAAMNCRLSGTETGLVAYWPFDASDLSDLTGHGHGGSNGGLAGSLTYASLSPLISCALSGVEDASASHATAPEMRVSPQPTRGPVRVSIDLPHDGTATLNLFDVGGRRLGTLASGSYSAGRHELAIDLRASGATGPKAGLLYMRLESGGKAVVRPVVLLR